jgi:hypothetical protein
MIKNPGATQRKDHSNGSDIHHSNGSNMHQHSGTHASGSARAHSVTDTHTYGWHIQETNENSAPGVQKTPEHTGGYGYSKGGAYHSKYQGPESTPDHASYGHGGNKKLGYGVAVAEGTPDVLRTVGGLEDNLKVGDYIYIYIYI